MGTRRRQAAWLVGLVGLVAACAGVVILLAHDRSEPAPAPADTVFDSTPSSSLRIEEGAPERSEASTLPVHRATKTPAPVDAAPLPSRPAAEKPSVKWVNPREAWDRAKPWIGGLGVLKTPRESDRLTDDLRSALTRTNRVDAHAALIALQDADVSALDRAAWRALVEPYAELEDAYIRWTARKVLRRFDPRPSELEAWVAEVMGSTRNDAETNVAGLVAAADGIVEGIVADAVLHLLRDGTDITKAFVVRGVFYGDFKRLEPRVVDRMVAVARAAGIDSYDASYFFVFIGRRLDPRPSNVVDAALDFLPDPGAGGDDGIVLTLTGGMDAPTKARVTSRMLEVAEGSDPFASERALRVLGAVATRAELPRIESIAADSTRSGLVRGVAARTAKTVAARQP